MKNFRGTTFVGMASGRSLLLFAAVATLFVMVATATEKRTVAQSNHLKNNKYGTTIKASTDWTPPMLAKFKLDMETGGTHVDVVSSDPIKAPSNARVAVCRLVLNKRAEKRQANEAENNYVADQKTYYDSSWVSKAKGVAGDGWTITEVDTDVEMKKYDIDGNINDLMSEIFYTGFTDKANSAFRLGVNHAVVVALVLGSLVASMVMW
eukprot:GHVS01039246.1.p1 GENE.GHVS01039246.1~~GHVS01039246.1.p1  ORF type:complete len:208 (+),score=27.69 GHVS01039246.1:76-699(+)